MLLFAVNDLNWWRKYSFIAGNMVVHFFLPEVREVYELEKLWTLGPQHDDQFRAMLQEDEYLNATHMGTTWNAPGNLHMKSLPEAGTSDK